MEQPASEVALQPNFKEALLQCYAHLSSVLTLFTSIVAKDMRELTTEGVMYCCTMAMTRLRPTTTSTALLARNTVLIREVRGKFSS